MNEHEALVDEAVRTKHTVLLIGGLDTGKTTLARDLLRAALSAGRPAAPGRGRRPEVGRKRPPRSR